MPVLSNASLPGNGLTGGLGDMISQTATSGALGALGLSQASNRMNIAGMYQYSDNTRGPTPQGIFFPDVRDV